MENKRLNISEQPQELEFKINEPNKQAYLNNKILDLTTKEFNILNLLFKSPNQTITRKTFLEKVWGFDHYVASRAVDIEIRRLRQKIEPDPENPKYIITKWGEGYYFKS